MMHIPDEHQIPKIVKNEWFYLLARSAMLFATAVGLPAAGFMMNRLINKADEISQSVTLQSTDLKILSALVQFQFKTDNDKLIDHESRLRIIEKIK